MKLVTYDRHQETRLGVLLGEHLVDLSRAWQIWRQSQAKPGSLPSRLPAEMVSLLSADPPLLDALQDALVFIAGESMLEGTSPSTGSGLIYRLDQISLRPPLLHPGKIVCAATNYPLPGSDPGDRPAYPVLFLKPASALAAHCQPVILPRASQEIICEGELAAIIARRGKHIPRSQAFHYLAGYTIANDIGARDLERRTSQWTTGKLSDTFLPLGPALVTRDEVPHPDQLTIRTCLNEQLVQDGVTGEMLFDLPELISYISSLATLEPGDLLLTGSPKTLDGHPAPAIPLRAGDTVQIEIERLGVLTNPTISEE